MARQPEFVDEEYDRKLAEYKAMKAKMKQESMSSSQGNLSR